MRWLFWTLLLLSFLFINETTVNWLLAVIVCGYGPQSGFERATQYFTLDSFLFSASFRIIPYIVLSAVALFSSLKNSAIGKIALYSSLATISIFHFWGYWGMQHSLFTPEHTSSTSALAIIFIPIHAIWLSAVTGTLGYGLAKVTRLVLNRA
ncbi:hypothetical protein EIK76_07570 [Rheinheimera mesophila]|uniref:Uncharacterized protein n=2 Tax=Rheinheimera mesophila TaxID=1547515 RepID=A0A3P3QU72_9GAMM|nr:hypothetical protein [Rheinheimera mesophila]RRJ23900.1 hypothetical protein EIK76_07570 [Rheinheimera mesophila]